MKIGRHEKSSVLDSASKSWSGKVTPDLTVEGVGEFLCLHTRC